MIVFKFFHIKRSQSNVANGHHELALALYTLSPHHLYSLIAPGIWIKWFNYSYCRASHLVQKYEYNDYHYRYVGSIPTKDLGTRMQVLLLTFMIIINFIATRLLTCIHEFCHDI